MDFSWVIIAALACFVLHNAIGAWNDVKIRGGRTGAEVRAIVRSELRAIDQERAADQRAKIDADMAAGKARS